MLRNFILIAVLSAFIPSQLLAGANVDAVKTTAQKSGKIDDIQRQAKELEKNLEAERAKQQALKEKQESLNLEIQKLQKDMVDTASRAQDQEEALNKLEDSLKDLLAQKNKATAAISKNHDSLSHILSALLRIKRQPPQALMAIPQTPIETAHSIILLRAMLPELDEKVKQLKSRLDEIAAVENTIEEKRDEVKNRTESLKQEQTKLGKLVKRRVTAQTVNLQAQQKQEERIQKLADQAGDLRDLIEKLEAERKARAAKTQAKSKFKPKPAKESAALDNFPLPAKGKIVTHFGEKNDLGAQSKGLVIETRSNAQIITPYPGEVVYAGNFRSYGLILIIEVGDGYHIMLSNLGRIDCVLGQNVVAGEPIGAMASSDSQPKLYVEFRKNGQPVSPQNWLAPNT